MKLLLDHVSKKYGNKYALKDLNIEFSDGVYGILGANGAGKTTLISIITGILQQTSGQVKLDGSDIKDMGTKYLDKIGYLPQYPQINTFKKKNITKSGLQTYCFHRSYVSV